MKMKKRDSRFLLIAVIASLLFIGAFLMGIGFQQFLDNYKIRKEYRESSLQWKQELINGSDEQIARDVRNQELVESMKHVSMNREIYFESESAEGEARIENNETGIFGCMVTLVRDATGETVYESGLIEPGRYIEMIRLKSNLRNGYYPCTAVWSFYTENEEYAGEMAWKIVVIIKG